MPIVRQHKPSFDGLLNPILDKLIVPDTVTIKTMEYDCGASVGIGAFAHRARYGWRATHVDAATINKWIADNADPVQSKA